MSTGRAAWRALATRSIRTQARSPEYTQRAGDFDHKNGRPLPSATPRQLVQYLDEFIVGQMAAKKTLAVAVFNHYNRVNSQIAATQAEQEASTSWEDQASDERHAVCEGAAEDAGGQSNATAASHLMAAATVSPHPSRLVVHSHSFLRSPSGPHFEKSNVLMIGPTGSGKTLLARTLAKVLDVPFSTSDATSFTQAGYVGEDVESCIQRLLQASQWDPQRASTGIVYIDEIDKIARRGYGVGADGLRDVGGEGVQQALLRMMEGSTITIHARPGGSEGSGESTPRGRHPRSSNGPKYDTYHVDTTNVLFILSGAFVGLDDLIKRRIGNNSIGFGVRSQPTKESPLPFFSTNANGPTILDQVESQDLHKYGFIPEFVSRVPSITTLAPLSEEDLMRILVDVKGSLVSQYTALFGYNGVEIRFTTKALREIARQAVARGGGARGLRAIMENLLLDSMFESPGSVCILPSMPRVLNSIQSIQHVLINEAVVQKRSVALYWSRGEGAKFWAAWASEEEADRRTQP